MGVRALPAEDDRLWQRSDIGVLGSPLLQSVFDAPEVALTLAVDAEDLAAPLPVRVGRPGIG